MANPCRKCGINALDCLCTRSKTKKLHHVPLRNGLTDDRMYKGKLDRGSNRVHEGYADYKAHLDRKGWVCTG